MSSSANKSSTAAAAIGLIGQLYGIEREVELLTSQQRLHERRTRAAPIARALHDWLLAQRGKITDRTATAKAIDYSLNHWAANCCLTTGRCGAWDNPLHATSPSYWRGSFAMSTDTLFHHA